VNKFFKTGIVSLVKIQIYSNLIFLRNKKSGKIVKRLEQILSRLVNNFFKNDIVSLVKIQIYKMDPTCMG
jgi:hypothetical protein